MTHQTEPSPDIVGPDLQRSSNKFYPSVQGLRGFSAFTVIGVHVYVMARNAGFLPANIPQAVLDGLSTLGCSTALFFVISGFVIPASLFRHHDVKRFFVDRVLRIMPVFVALHLLVFTIGPFIGYKWLRGVGFLRYCVLFLTNLTFIAEPLGLPVAQQNSWTLTYEWAFYIFIATSWVALSRNSGRRWPLLAVIGLVALALCIVFPRCWPFLLGLALARWRPTWHLNRGLEIAIVPVCTVAFFYLDYFVGQLVAMPFALVIFWAVFQDGTFTARFLETRPLQFLGKISYSLYLVHPIAMFGGVLIAQHLVHKGWDPRVVFAMFAVYAVITAPILSTVCYHLFEVRARQILVAWMKPAPPKELPRHGTPLEVDMLTQAAGKSRPA